MATSYEDIVQGAYSSIGRTGLGNAVGQIDKEGYDFWLNALKAGAVSPDQLYANFNQAVATTLQQKPEVANSQAVAAYIADKPLASKIDPNKVLAIGDSTTYGELSGNQVKNNMVTTAQKELGSGYTVSNLGINSTTAGDFLNSTAFDKALSSSAGTVVLNYGMNEAFRNEDTATFANNLATAVQTLQAVGKTVILQTPNKTGVSTKIEDAWMDNVGAYADVVRDVAKQTGTTLDDKFTYTSGLKNATSATDLIHPTEATYAKLGTNLADAIKTATTGVAPKTIAVTAPAAQAASSAVQQGSSVSTGTAPTANLKDQLLSQWSQLGVKELPGGISLADRASALADTMKQNGITNLADLKLGSKTVSVDDEGGTAPVSYLTNNGQQLGFLGNVNENLKNKADYLQPNNLVSWASAGGGNVAYKAVQTADGKVAIVPQWNSSSDMQFVRDAAKAVALVYGAGALASGGLFAGTAAGSGLSAAELATLTANEGAMLGGGGLLGGAAAGGLTANQLATLTANEAAGFGSGLTSSQLASIYGAGGLSAADLATLTANEGALMGSGLTAAELASIGLGTGAISAADLATLTANEGALMGSGLTAAQLATLGLGGSALLTGGGVAAGGGATTLADTLTKAAVTGGATSLVNNVLGGGTSNLGSLFNTGLTTAGGLLQQQTSKEAAQKAQAMIDAETAAAKASAQFRPVGMTTRFGTSQFGYDPKTGQMTSAGYTLSPEAKAQQDRFVALSNAGLTQAEGAQAQFAPLQTGAQSLFSLGNQYLAQSPQAVAQNYLNQQMALLQPGREQELATLQNRLQQQGRGGLSVAQGGTMGATTPELQALYNARAQQEAQLAANAQQAGQQQVLYGAGLLGQGTTAMGNYYAGQQAAYAPYTTAQGQVQNLETLGQQPFNMSTALAGQTSTAGARAGQLGLEGAKLSTALATGQAATTNPYATLLGGLGGSNPFGQVLGNAANSLFAGGGLIDRTLYPSGNPLQTGIYADPSLWT